VQKITPQAIIYGGASIETIIHSDFWRSYNGFG
jgi:hypothetical protein